MKQGVTLSKFVVGFADRCSYAVLVCKIWLLIQMLFPHPPSKVGGHLSIIGDSVPDN